MTPRRSPLPLAGRFSRRRPAEGRPRPPVIRGCSQRVIVVRPPDRRFREAVFVLREDYWQDPEADRERLLAEAEDAAKDYIRSLWPASRSPSPLWLLALLPPAAVLLLLLF